MAKTKHGEDTPEAGALRSIAAHLERAGVLHFAFKDLNAIRASLGMRAIDALGRLQETLEEAKCRKSKF